MNITYLREFIEVVLGLNMSSAAKKLHVSQPALSKHIAALEQECQVELLKRGASRVQLTPAGQVLFEEAVRLIDLHDGALAKVRARKDAVVLNVGGLCKNARVIALINRALSRLNATGPCTSTAYQDYRHQPWPQLLLGGRVDVVFTMLASPAELPEGLAAAPLFDDPLICLARRDDPLVGRGPVSLEELEGRTILQPVGSYSTEHGRSTVDRIFACRGVHPFERPVFLHSISELATVENPDGLFIMERSMLTAQPFTDEYRVVEFLEPDASFTFYAVWDAETRTRNEALARFTAALAEAATGSAAA